MKKSDQSKVNFEVTDKLKTRGLELLDESQAIQFAEGIRLNNAVSNVFAREHQRLEQKYGKDDPRTNDMQVRMKANAEAKTALRHRYTEALTPQPDPADGWVVDGFVRNTELLPVKGVTVAAYDAKGTWYATLGHACTDERGYFSIVASELPERQMQVYMRASRGKKLLESNEVQLFPAAKSADRVEIIIGKQKDSDDCQPPSGGKAERMPPEDRKEPDKKPVEKEPEITTKPKTDKKAKKKALAIKEQKLEEERKKALEAEKKKSLKRN